MDGRAGILNASTEGFVLANQLEPGAENPFEGFVSEPPKEGDHNKRHYFESVAATLGVNRNNFEYTPKALQELADGFIARKPLAINHDKGAESLAGKSKDLGYGSTVAARVVDGKLYVASYLSLAKTTPNGPFGSTDEIRDGIVDGFIGSVSASSLPKSASCSVCGKPYPIAQADFGGEGMCQHYRGERVRVMGADGEPELKTVHVVIDSAEALELSLVEIPADRGSGIVKKAVNMSMSDFIDTEYAAYLSGEAVGGNDAEPISEDLEAVYAKLLSDSQSPTFKAESDARIIEIDNELVALDAQITGYEEQNKNLVGEIAAAKTEIDTLNSKIDQNEVALTGIVALRARVIDAYIKRFVAVTDGCTEEMVATQKELLEDFTIEQIQASTRDMEPEMRSKFPAGRSVVSPNHDDTDSSGEYYPVGV